MTKEKYPHPKYLLDITVCEIIYKTYRDLQKSNKLYPLRDFSTRYEGRLESVIYSINLRGTLVQEDLVKFSARYFVYLVTSQVFMDGNKRMAVLFSTTFLTLNGYKLSFMQTDFARIALAVSKTNSRDREEITQLVYDIFSVNITKVD